MYENNKFRSYWKYQQGNEYWRCTIDGCTARPKTSNGSELVDMISNNHTHSDTVVNETVQALRTSCKRKAIETACERPFKVMRTVLGNQDDFDVTSSDVNNLRAALYRERRKYCGTLPNNVDDSLGTLQQLILF